MIRAPAVNKEHSCIWILLIYCAEQETPLFFTFPQTPFLILRKFIHKTYTWGESNYASLEPIPLHNKLFYWSGNNYHSHIIKYLEQIGRSGYWFSRAPLHFSLYDCCTELDEMSSSPHSFWGLCRHACTGFILFLLLFIYLACVKVIFTKYIQSQCFLRVHFWPVWCILDPFLFCFYHERQNTYFFYLKCSYFYFSCPFFCLIIFLKAEPLFLALGSSASPALSCSFLFLTLTFPLSMVYLQGCLRMHQLCGMLHYPAICRPMTLTPAAHSNSHHSKPTLTPPNPAQTHLPCSNWTCQSLIFTKSCMAGWVSKFIAN